VNRLKTGGGREGNVAQGGLLHDGLGKRMLGGLLQRGGHTKQLFFGNPLAGKTSVTFGLPSVTVPVLSSTTVLTLCKSSSASARFDQDAVLGALARSGHNGNRRGKPKGQGRR
jgi:hypothetical protein